MRNIVLMVLILIITACSPYKFKLNSHSYSSLEGFNLHTLESFQHINDNSFILKSGKAAVRAFTTTQNEIKFNYKILSGNSVSFNVRTVAHEFNNDKGLAFSIDEKGMKIHENGTEKGYYSSIRNKIEEMQFVRIRNNGNYTLFTHNCDSLKIETKLMNTEYIIFSVPENTEILISGVSIEKIFETPSNKNINF